MSPLVVLAAGLAAVAFLILTARSARSSARRATAEDAAWNARADRVRAAQPPAHRGGAA